MLDFVSHFFYSMILDKVLSYLFRFLKKIHKRKAVQVILAIFCYFIALNIMFRVSEKGSAYNPIQEFGFSMTDDIRTIKKKFRSLSKKLHPDRYPENMEAYMKLIDIYETLTDSQARYIYDKFGIIIGKKSDEVVKAIFQGIISTYSHMLMFIPFLLFNLFSPFKFKVVYSLMLVLISLFTYMIFIKKGIDPLNILFPGLMTFQIVQTLTSQILYQIVFISKLISFASESKIKMQKKMIEDVKKFYKNYQDSLHESLQQVKKDVDFKMKKKLEESRQNSKEKKEEKK